jgi:hypothetical protein
MKTNPDKPADQRKELEDSERKAAAEQPGSYKDDATRHKVVEIPPVTETPIRGLDPK